MALDLTIPSFLCEDDGVTMLHGIRPRTQWREHIWYIAQDMGHAPVGSVASNQKRIWELLAVAGGTNSRPSIGFTPMPTVGYAVTLKPFDPSYTGLTLGKCSTALSVESLHRSTEKVVEKWCDPASPCMTFVPLIDSQKRVGRTYPWESWVVNGTSYQPCGWVVCAVVCYLGFRADVAEEMQKDGSLCTIIKEIVLREVSEALGKFVDMDNSLPSFDGTQLTAMQHLELCTRIARRANEIGATEPEPEPVDPLEEFFQNEAKRCGVTDRDFSNNYYRMTHPPSE